MLAAAMMHSAMGKGIKCESICTMVGVWFTFCKLKVNWFEDRILLNTKNPAESTYFYFGHYTKCDIGSILRYPEMKWDWKSCLFKSTLYTVKHSLGQKHKKNRTILFHIQ